MWLCRLLHRIGLHMEETTAYYACNGDWCLAERRCRVCLRYGRSHVVRRPER